jgi:hypothetical protein
LTGDGQPFSIKSGSEVTMKAGTVDPVSEIQVSGRTLQPPVVREEHRILPSPVTRQIVSTQVGLALEVGKELQQTASPGEGNDLSGTTVKGAILSSSVGLPSIPGFQTAATGHSASPSTLPTSATPSIQVQVRGV